LKGKKKSFVRSNKRTLLTVGIAYVVIGACLVLFASFSTPASPPVSIVWGETGIKDLGGVYFDVITIQNHSEQSVTVVVAVKTALDGSPRVSAPVTVCGQCKASVMIEEVQPTPDMNSDYYQGAIGTPEYVHVNYAPTLLSSFASSALPLGFGAVALGILVLTYSRPSKR
jgi:hypothetical protein